MEMHIDENEHLGCHLRLFIDKNKKVKLFNQLLTSFFMNIYKNSLKISPKIFIKKSYRKF